VSGVKVIESPFRSARARATSFNVNGIEMKGSSRFARIA
jgi:hypothetical protein